MQQPNHSIKILKCKVCGADVKCNANYPINELTCKACYASTNPSMDSWQGAHLTTQTPSRCAILTESRGETPSSPLHQWTIHKLSTFPPKARQSCYAYSIDSQSLTNAFDTDTTRQTVPHCWFNWWVSVSMSWWCSWWWYDANRASLCAHSLFRWWVAWRFWFNRLTLWISRGLLPNTRFILSQRILGWVSYPLVNISQSHSIWLTLWGYSQPHSITITFAIIMFFTPSSRNAVKSSAIKDIEVNQSTNQAVVTYNNGNQYLYSGICEDAMFDIIFGQVKSFGKWVNTALLRDADVSTFKLAWFVNTFQTHTLSIY